MFMFYKFIWDGGLVALTIHWEIKTWPRVLGSFTSYNGNSYRQTSWASSSHTHALFWPRFFFFFLGGGGSSIKWRKKISWYCKVRGFFLTTGSWRLSTFLFCSFTVEESEGRGKLFSRHWKLQGWGERLTWFQSICAVQRTSTMWHLWHHSSPGKEFATSPSGVSPECQVPMWFLWLHIHSWRYTQHAPQNQTWNHRKNTLRLLWQGVLVQTFP